GGERACIRPPAPPAAAGHGSGPQSVADATAACPYPPYSPASSTSSCHTPLEYSRGGQGGQARPALKERPVGPCPISPSGIYGEGAAGDQVRSTGGGPDDEW